MTEANWNTATDPQRMLAWLSEQGRLSDRKARLFAVACCRRFWTQLTDERSRTAVEAAELYADGQSGERVLGAAGLAVADVLRDADEPNRALLDGVGWSTAGFSLGLGQPFAYPSEFAAKTGALVAESVGGAERRRAAERLVQAHLLRDLVGNPFRPPPTLTPSLLTWRDGLIGQLAEAIYAERAFTVERLAVLVDALEACGCADAELLGHLRGPGPHAGRGCWAVDLVLGKT